VKNYAGQLARCRLKTAGGGCLWHVCPDFGRTYVIDIQLKRTRMKSMTWTSLEGCPALAPDMTGPKVATCQSVAKEVHL
jgi:hypothetical protein